MHATISAAAALDPTTGFDDRPVVVGVDARGASDAAIAWAVTFARSAGRPIRAVMVASSPTVFPSGLDGFGLVMPDPDLFEASVALERALDRALPDPEARAAVQSRILVGGVSDCLLREAEDASLLVLGGASGRRRRLLSTAKTVMSRAACPVVVVPTGGPPPTPDRARRPEPRAAELAMSAPWL